MSIELKWGGTDDGKEQRRQRQSTRELVPTPKAR